MAGNRFQSASEPKPGRNLSDIPVSSDILCFNPRPSRSPDETTESLQFFHQISFQIRVRAEARTKLYILMDQKHVLRVSIRVRAEARTKPGTQYYIINSTEFQSASEPKPGRNRFFLWRSKDLQGFNPRPSRSPDETACQRKCAFLLSFQSASEPKPGRNSQVEKYRRNYA